MKILIVDDNDVNRILLQKIFAKTGYDFRIVSSGREALMAFEEEFYQTVFMDIQMPGMDGFETAGKIKERLKEGSRHPFFVALTASSMSGERERCIENGMDEYLAKPFSAAEVNRIIDETLKLI